MTTLGPNLTVDCATREVASTPATADQQAASDAAAQVEQQAALAESTLREWAITTAQSCVGLSVASLTLAQMKALLAWVVYEHGMVDKSGVVTPVANWH